MDLAALFDWGHIKNCIAAHEAQTGHRPTHVSVPIPKGFEVLGVIVTVHSGEETVTGDPKNIIHHQRIIHTKPIPTLVK